MRRFLLIGLLLLSTKVFPQDPNFHIYLCFGQSNMEGQGTIETIDRTVDSRFRVMEAVDCSNLGRAEGSWYSAVPPLCRCYNGLSPSDYFGRTMALNLPDSIRVGVINVSVGGCKIEMFDKDHYQDYLATITEDWFLDIVDAYGGNPYGRLVEMAKLAQHDGVIKGILLHQGESNTGDTGWPAKVKGVYDNLVNDLGLDPDSIPLLAGEVVNADQGGVCASMNSIIDRLPQTLQNSYVIASSGCTAGTDNLHFNSAGYREIGKRYAVTMLTIMGYDPADLKFVDVSDPNPKPELPKGRYAFYFDPECATIGGDWDIFEDTLASCGKYVTVKAGTESLAEPDIDSAASIYFPFRIDSAGTYSLYARVNCPGEDENSFWIRPDNRSYSLSDGLNTSGWQWLKLKSYELPVGEHTITMTYREDGAMLDRICITDDPYGPSEMGDSACTCQTDPGTTEGVRLTRLSDGYELGQNYPNPFSGTTSIICQVPEDTRVSLKVFNMIGVEVAELAGDVWKAGKHTVEFNSQNLPPGNYFYILKTDRFLAFRRMMLVGERGR
jgi:hypothetical protein